MYEGRPVNDFFLSGTTFTALHRLAHPSPNSRRLLTAILTTHHKSKEINSRIPTTPHRISLLAQSPQLSYLPHAHHLPRPCYSPFATSPFHSTALLISASLFTLFNNQTPAGFILTV